MVYANLDPPTPVAAADVEMSEAYVLSNDDGPWKDELPGGGGETSDGQAGGRQSRRPRWLQSLSGRVVTDAHFETFILVLVVINSVLMGVATSDAVFNNPRARRAFEIVDVAFLALFTVELILDFCHRGLDLFKSGWLTFDFLVITLSWAFPVLQIMRAFRCLRLLGRIQSVRQMFLALQSVLPMLASIVVLLASIFYVFAVIFTDLFKTMYREGLTSDDYFSRLDKTLFTLFQVMTGAGWPDICREVMKTYEWAWMPFVSFIFITMFVVIELTVAALCKSVSKMDEMGIMPGCTGGVSQDDRIASLERTIDILTNKTSNKNGRNARQMASSAPPVLTGNPHRIRVAWYDEFDLSFDALSFEGHAVSSSSNSESAELRQRYNYFPIWFQSLSTSVVKNGPFQTTIIAFIVINSVTMGIATFDFVTENAQMLKIFNGIDLVFLLVFTAELLFQFGYRGLSFFGYGWLCFDFIVVALSWVFPSVQAARAFRCFRLFSRVHFMRHIIVALFSVVPKIGVITALLLLMFYIFSVVFTDLFKHMFDDGLTSEDYFSNISNSLFTLFQCMTIAGWPDIAREVMVTYSWAWIPFVTWIVLSKFILIQLVIAVLCQSLSHVSTEEEMEDESDKITSLEKKVEMLSSNINALVGSGEIPTLIGRERK